jgi:hypothetical protein
MKQYIKHLVECKCILPQFKNVKDPVFHKFVVFSELEEETAAVKVSYSQCAHCGAIHKVKEIGISDILNKDTMLSIASIEDMKLELPEKMCVILERNQCEIHSYQEAKFIIDNKLWGSTIILSKERDADNIIGKYLIVLDRDVYKVEMFEMYNGLV